MFGIVGFPDVKNYPMFTRWECDYRRGPAFAKHCSRNSRNGVFCLVFEMLIKTILTDATLGVNDNFEFGGNAHAGCYLLRVVFRAVWCGAPFTD